MKKELSISVNEFVLAVEEFLLEKPTKSDLEFNYLIGLDIVDRLSDELKLPKETVSKFIEFFGIKTDFRSELIIVQEKEKSGFVAFQVEPGKQPLLNNATSTILFETTDSGDPHLLKIAGIKGENVLAAQYLIEPIGYVLKSVDIGLSDKNISREKESRNFLSSIITYPNNEMHLSAGYINANMALITKNTAKYHISQVANFEEKQPRNAPTINAAGGRCIPAIELGLNISATPDNYLKVSCGRKPVWEKVIAPMNLSIR
jgi:hypothetical protein